MFLRIILFSILCNLFIFTSCSNKINAIDYKGKKTGKWVIQLGDSLIYSTYKNGILNGKYKLYVKSNLDETGGYKNNERIGKSVFYQGKDIAAIMYYFKDGSFSSEINNLPFPSK